MAASDYFELTQQIYISYFGRPADPRGLDAFAAALDGAQAPTDIVEFNAFYKANAGVKALVDSFGTSNESNVLYGSGDVDSFISAVFQNVLGRAPKIGGLNFWNAEITSGRVTKAGAALAIMAGAFANTTDPEQAEIDQAVITKKVAVADAFTASLADDVTQLLAYKGQAAAATARGLLQNVNATTDVAAYNANVEIAISQIVVASIPTTKADLTVGVDNLPSTNGNDTYTANASTLSALDVINGGNGTDTLNVNGVNANGQSADVDLSLPASITNIEVMNVTATASELASGTVDLTGYAGLQTATINLGAISRDYDVTAGSVDVTFTATKGNGNDININGGKVVSVKNSIAASDDINVTGGDATTSVTTNGGDTVTITDAGTEADTIATASLSGFASDSTINSDALKTLTVANTAADLAVTADALSTLNVTKISSVVTVTADAGTRVLAVNANGTTAGAGVVDNAATGVTLAVTGTKADLDLTTDVATSLTVTGDKALTLTLNPDATLATINASGLTSDITVTSDILAGTAYTGAAGVDTITVAAGNTKAVNTGAGDDVVTVSAAVGTGGTIDGGEGTNTLMMTAANAATVSATDTFEAGISNFQKLSLAAVSGAAVTINLANLDSINYVKSAGAVGGVAGTAKVESLTVTGSAANVAEVQTITAGAATGAGSIAVGGVLINLLGTETDADVAALIADELVAIQAQNPNVASVTALGNVVTVTYNGTAGDVGQLSTNANGVVAGLNVATTTPGDLGSGNITVGGVAIALTAGMTATQVASAIVAQSAAIITANPSVASITSNAGVVTVTYNASAGNVPTLTYVDTGATGAGGVVATVTTGVAAVSAGFALTNFANNGTLELNGALTSASSVALGDASGTSDSLNLLLSATAGFANTAALTANGFETIAITTADTDGSATAFAAPITANAVKTVTVTGNAGLDLTGLTATTLTSLNASGVTATGAAGAVTITTGALADVATLTTGAGNDSVTATAATKAVTVNTGAGNDTITVSNGQNNTVNGGAGNDNITLGNGNNTVDGGAGNDQITVGTGANVIKAGDGNDIVTIGRSVGLNDIDVGGGNDTVKLSAAPSAAGFYATVTGMGAGDKLDFSAVVNGVSSVDGKLGAKLTLGGAANFANYLDAATAGNGATDSLVKWFTFDGDTYVVVDSSSDNTFQDGDDSVIQLVGTVDLSNATTNGTHVVTLV